MKTTIEISDELFNEAKQAAIVNGESFRQLLELSLRMELANRKAAHSGFKLRKACFQGNGLAAGIDWANIRDGIYEGRGE